MLSLKAIVLYIIVSSIARLSLINLATGKIGGSGKDTAACVVLKYCVLSIFKTGA